MSKFLANLVRSEGKSCAGKLKFPREDSAQRSADDMMRKKPGETFEHYKCAHCEGWHIGHRTNFDWIPADHRSYHLIVVQHRCSRCTEVFLSHTVVSARVIQHFPDIVCAREFNVVCVRCKNIIGLEQSKRHLEEQGRKIISLRNVPLDSQITVQELWDNEQINSFIGDDNAIFELNDRLIKENKELRLAVRNMSGDNLCWLNDLEVGKALPREEFMQSCGRYYEQISAEKGIVPPGCRTIAQLEARIVELQDELDRWKKRFDVGV